MKNEMLHERRDFETVRDLVEWAGEEYADRKAFSYRPVTRGNEIVTVTFRELREDVRGLASEMLAMGCAGKHCVVIGKFSYDWVVTYYAILSIGGVIVPLDRDWQGEDLADTIGKADASFLFCEEELAAKEEMIRAKVPALAPTVWLQAKLSERSVPALIAAGKERYAVEPDPYHGAPIDHDAMSLLVFTSGTTGKGKGVMLSQTAILSDLSAIIPYIDFGQKTVGVLPPHHTYGSSVMLIGHAMIGCEIYISAGIRYVAKELKEQQPEHLVLVPLYLETFYRKIQATLKEKGKLDFVMKMIKLSNGLRKTGIDLRGKLFKQIMASFGGKVKMIISGGAPINPDILYFFDGLGITTLNGYGITECAPIVAVNRSRQSFPGSVGHVLDIDTVRIDDPNEDGEGEICVKGPNVMLGYYKNEAATAEAMDEEGFFHTGDYGKLAKNNVLYITGRKKNLIVLSNGKNVYPEEIENELVATPGVIDIIVYEGQSRRGLEHNAIVAEIYPDKDYIETNGITDVYAHLKGYIDNYNRAAVPYKKIGVLKVRETEFPKNTLRKIQRFQLDMTID
ncbi:MAG: hypothetical protein E7618_01430 [Ruminococcaceae bacterium]|nr:hypothetical protein [Oscillospiraceae bacterium]